MIGAFHVQPEVIDLYNHWLEEMNPDTAFDEFVSEAVKGFFQLNSIVPAVVEEGKPLSNLSCREGQKKSAS